MLVERQNNRTHWVVTTFMAGAIGGILVRAGGPWTARRRMDGFIGLLADMWPALFVLGLIGIASAALTWRNGARAASWPATQGGITRSRMMLALGVWGALAAHGKLR